MESQPDISVQSNLEMSSPARQTSASPRAQQKQGFSSNNNTSSTRTDNLADNEGARAVDAESFITKNVPQVDARGFVKDGVHQGAFGDYTAKNGERGLTSDHFYAMQDHAMTGTFHLQQRGTSEGQEESMEKVATPKASKSKKGSAAARGGGSVAAPKESGEESDDDGDAAGPSTTPATSTNPPAGNTPLSRLKDGQERFNTAWVAAHPHENYTHMGKGWWKRGLPDPTDNPKSGVRGPGAKDWKGSNPGNN